jgi:Arc/MetJ-type ribon-helix-helix transcriptional regulator
MIGCEDERTPNMAIQISPKAQAAIEELIASGRYPDQDRAVEAAVVKLATEERKLAWLKAELDIAREHIERGEVIEFTRERAEYLMQQARENAQAGKPIRDAVKP